MMIWLYALVNALLLLWGFRYARRVGYRTVIPFVVSLALLLIYCLITPIGFYLLGRETATGDAGYFRFVGKRITDYYEPGMLAYMIANGCFVVGFRHRHEVESVAVGLLPAPTSLPRLRRLVIGLYVVFMGVVLTDIILSGIDVLDMLLGNSNDRLMTSQSVTNTYYFRAFADSIITTIILYAYLNGSWLKLFLLIVPAFVLFALLGFRYRMILTVLGLVLIYFQYGTKINGWRWAGVGVALLYFVLTITHNRWFFITGAYDRISLNPSTYSYTLLLDQTRGSLADFNLLRYYDENPGLSHDYGTSMFGYVIIRAIPKQLFPTGEKPYPSPFIDVLDKSLELPSGWLRIGEATLHYGAFYAAFGWLGFFIMPFVMGRWISYVCGRNPSTMPVGFLKQILFSLALFQLITRGYFPQFVDHFVYLSIPLWLIDGRIRKATIAQPTVLIPADELVY